MLIRQLFCSGCTFGPPSSTVEGQHRPLILGYSFNGALHMWAEGEAGGGIWEPQVTPGGHFGPVEDCDWERKGR